MAQWNFTNWLPGEWITALYELTKYCAESEANETDCYIRRMNELLTTAPNKDLLKGLRAIDPPRLELLLAIGAHETAAMAMLIDDAGYMLSRSYDGQSLATVALPGLNDEKSAAGATPALALVAAVALSLSSAPSLTSSRRGGGKSSSRAALH
ncbi:hypothetical protein ABVV53_15135 [Novosphingobium sp. RD2P27]|uniref:Uncharacterized protein n=1 Tax=Novosphingobium kalidii TaxID=3230299 RepID=A0ABV2D4P8_9SPHN